MASPIKAANVPEQSPPMHGLPTPHPAEIPVEIPVEIRWRSGGDPAETPWRLHGDFMEILRRSCGDPAEITQRSHGDMQGLDVQAATAPVGGCLMIVAYRVSCSLTSCEGIGGEGGEGGW